MEIKKNGHDYIIVRDDGTSVELQCNEVSLLVNFVGKEGLRAQINDRIDFAVDEKGLDLDKYEGTREAFVDEIFADLEDEVDYGNSVDDSDIDDKIRDLADFYELYANDDDDEEEDE